MFTGIIEATSQVIAFQPLEKGARLSLHMSMASELQLGESVAINGCCLTVSELHVSSAKVSFDLLQETLNKTNLGMLAQGQQVNYERSLLVGGRMSGHYVQGHVDTTAEVLDYRRVGQDHCLVVRLPGAFAAYTVEKGSICVDGMSLTIAELSADRFTIWITPHTHLATRLSDLVAGDIVNLEFDVLAKYVERILACRSPA